MLQLEPSPMESELDLPSQVNGEKSAGSGYNTASIGLSGTGHGATYYCTTPSSSSFPHLHPLKRCKGIDI